jgi:hypothetical protein
MFPCLPTNTKPHPDHDHHDDIGKPDDSLTSENVTANDLPPGGDHPKRHKKHNCDLSGLRGPVFLKGLSKFCHLQMLLK